MAYEPYEKQTWVDGTTPIDAEHMNHIEDGIEKAEKNVTVYRVTDSSDNKMKLSWTLSRFTPVLSSDLYALMWGEMKTVQVNRGLRGSELIVSFESNVSSQYGKNTYHTYSDTFVENDNHELVLQE